MRRFGPETDWVRLRQFMFAHPSTCPDMSGVVTRLVENPSPLSPTWRLVRFRDRMRDLVAAEPDDEDWPAFLACTEAALTYRQTVPPEYHFWHDFPSPVACES